jgi:hypothetical protein
LAISVDSKTPKHSLARGDAQAPHLRYIGQRTVGDLPNRQHVVTCRTVHAEYGGRRYNPILNQFAERLLATGMPKKAVICAVMHKLTHLIYGVIRTGKPFDANYLSKNLAIQDGI